MIEKIQKIIKVLIICFLVQNTIVILSIVFIFTLENIRFEYGDTVQRIYEIYFVISLIINIMFMLIHNVLKYRFLSLINIIFLFLTIYFMSIFEFKG